MPTYTLKFVLFELKRYQENHICSFYGSLDHNDSFATLTMTRLHTL